MSCSAQKAPGFYDGGNLCLTEEAESVSGEGCRLAVELTGCLTQINDFFFFFPDGKQTDFLPHFNSFLLFTDVADRAAWVHCFAKQTDTVSVKKQPS